MTPGTIITLFVAVSFLLFGVDCLLTARMRDEFDRYHLAAKRKLVGSLQILGGSGLIAGLLFWQPLLIFSAAGLCLLMLLGVGLRIRLGDPFWAALPALIFALLNLLLILWAAGVADLTGWMS